MARSNAVGKLRDIVEAGLDPKTALLKEVGKGSPETTAAVLGCKVLVATYAGSKFHAGTKILRTDTDLVEQRYQGSVGLVIGMGPGAFVDAPGASFHGVTVKVGDWVLTRPADGTSTFINQVPCRIFEDVNILMKIEDPSAYY